jgi:hypothetical protein
VADFRTKIAATGPLPFCHVKGNAGLCTGQWIVFRIAHLVAGWCVDQNAQADSR